MDVAFKGPTFIGSYVDLRASADATGPGTVFELYSGENPRPSVVGRIRAATASDGHLWVDDATSDDQPEESSGILSTEAALDSAPCS